MPPTSSQQVPLGSDWDFRHLGPRYFEHWFARCAHDGLRDIAWVYTGNEGYPYIEATHGRRLAPNFMAKNLDGTVVCTYQNGTPKRQPHIREHVIEWSFAEIADFLDQARRRGP